MNKTICYMLIVIMVAATFGCATNPNKIGASYVSSRQYDDYDCDQLSDELERVNRRADELYKSLKKESNADAAQMAVGMALFWPALFFLEGGDGPEATEYARLKGEREALEKSMVQRKCK